MTGRVDPPQDRTRRIVDVLMALRPGEVTTYGDVADVAGFPGRSRLVGRLRGQTSFPAAPLPAAWARSRS